MCRTGLGALLLGFHSVVAHNLPPVTKVMLTVFVSNERAVVFYHKQHFVLDAISPPTRTLRGSTYEPDYLILSKTIRADDDSSGASDGSSDWESDLLEDESEDGQ